MKLMKPISKMVALGLLTVATVAQAQVTLNVDDNIKVTAINGQSVNSSMFQRMQKTFQLEPGQHVITAKYERLYEFRNDDHEFVRSNNITLNVNMDDNQTYKLVMPNQPEAYADAKDYVKKPTLAVRQGNQIIASESITTQSTGLFASLGSVVGLGNSGIQQNSQAIAAVNSTNTAPAAVANTVNVNQNNKSRLDQFMQLWLEATPQEREKIRQWIAQ